ncbi:MAG: hypothetical protein A2Y12_02515 [Planctomycetes bacterium GWF2_42_9]|nr:MAG: hypothetical protein A2Y12_02515 [Planctomycetes bacterium GWF2_42_9]
MNATLPLYQRAEKRLYKLVRLGTQNGLSRLPTESDLANQLDMSVGTVRNAIKSLCDKKIVDRKQGKGTFLSKEVLDGRKTVALIWGLSDQAALTSRWHGMLHSFLESHFLSKGWSTITYELFHGNANLDLRAAERLKYDAETMKFSVAVKIDLPQIGEAKIKEIDLQQFSIPIISITNRTIGDAVIMDYYALGYEGVKYLCSKKGISSIALINCKGTDGHTETECKQGFENAVNKFSVESHENWRLSIDASVEIARKTFKSLWQSEKRPAGLVVGDDVLFSGIVCGMIELGIKYPDDIQLVSLGLKGVDNSLKYKPARLVFDPDYTAHIVCVNIIEMIENHKSTMPSIKIVPYLEEHVFQAESKINNQSLIVV